MQIKNRYLLILASFIILFDFVLIFFLSDPEKRELKILGFNIITKEVKKPKEIDTLGKTKIKYPQDYTFVLLGDSMTEALGNSDELKSYLKEYYPRKSFEVLNYGFGSTNILSAQERLEKETFYGRTFRPILNIAFDVILIESFGHNPLSQFPLDEGLKKQIEALDKIVSLIKIENPKSKIIFVATIAPNKYKYAEGVVTLSAEQKEIWVNERIAYIKNHINYAKEHQIPLINIFEKSLDNNGDGNLKYVNNTGFIHPSPEGIYFISEQIAKEIFANKLL